jgi:hypothetical protein
VTSIDFNANEEATTNVLLEKSDSLEEQGKRVLRGVSGQFDAIVCVAGGWAGGNAASDGKDVLTSDPRLSRDHHLPFCI